MTSTRFSLRAPLTLALAAALAACSQAPNEPAPVAEPTPAVEETTAPVEAAIEPTPAASNEEQEARISSISVTLHADPSSEAFPVTQQGGQQVASLKAGDTFHVCIRNGGETNALFALAVQGKNIDLADAHTHRPLWQLNAGVTRCMPAFIVVDAESVQTPVVAWNVFFADGEDGSSIEDTSFAPTISEHIWLGSVGEYNTATAWPATAPATPAPDAPAAGEQTTMPQAPEAAAVDTP